MKVELTDNYGNTAVIRTANDGTVSERQYDLACRKLNGGPAGYYADYTTPHGAPKAKRRLILRRKDHSDINDV